MRNKLRAWLRWPAVICIWLLIAVIAIPVLLAHWIGGVGLSGIERLASLANDLRAATDE